MIKVVDIVCAWCKQTAQKPKREIDRQRRNGKHEFFCSISCAAHAYNSKRKSVYIEKTCPVCQHKFTTKKNCKEATFCSRQCASKGSMTDYRRIKARVTFKRNIEKIASSSQPSQISAASLKSRESWKYVKLHRYLNVQKLRHEFEFNIENTSYVYDLALLDFKLAIEFDGREHNSTGVKQKDHQKDKAAEQAGWRVIRIKNVKRNSVIPISYLSKALLLYFKTDAPAEVLIQN